MNTFINICGIVLALLATVQSANYTAPIYSVYFKDMTPDDRFVKAKPQPKPPHHRVGAGRIYRGAEVSEAEQAHYNYQVKLVTKKARGAFGCGGTIIGDSLILTAAHCLHGGLSAKVYIGIRNQYDRQNSQQQALTPDNWKIHELYNDDEIVNDIALLLLPKPIIFSDTVGKVKLPPAGTLCPSFAGNGIVISGWGALDDDNTAPTMLQFANVKVAPPEKCEKIYTTSFLPASMVCADATSSGTCQGDSGGPMIGSINGKSTIIGIVSFGAEKCEHSTHRVFTCVAHFVPWILENGAKYFIKSNIVNLLNLYTNLL